jgi:hypothetical protein
MKITDVESVAMQPFFGDVLPTRQTVIKLSVSGVGNTQTRVKKSEARKAPHDTELNC